MLKRHFVSSLAATIILSACGGTEDGSITAIQSAEAQEKQQVVDVKIESTYGRVSYVYAYKTVDSLLQDGVSVDEEAFIAAVRDRLADKQSRVSEADAQVAIKVMQQELQEKAMAGSGEALVASESFLAKNATKEGVITTGSGLQYKVLNAGNGPKPGSESKVRVHYEGKLINGTVFDSSISRGTPIDFGVTQVIPGWTEALKLMSEGSKWELYIHPKLAYGTNAPPSIGPNQALIFQVELLKANVK